MSLKTRTITNKGEPLVNIEGQPLVNVKISFNLVDAIGKCTDVFDSITFERVSATKITTLTDENGEFSINLFPTERASSVCFYKCHVNSPHVQDFIASVADGDLPLSWYKMKQSSEPFEQNELSALEAHLQNDSFHRQINDTNATEYNIWSALKILNSLNEKSGIDHQHERSEIINAIKSGSDITVDESGNVTINANSHEHVVDNISDFSEAIINGGYF